MKKAFFVSAILSFILSLLSLDVQASLTDEETVVLARATSGGKKRLAAAIIAAGYDSLDDWLDSLAAPVIPPIDADIQGLLNTLGPIPVGTVPLTRTQQALNLRNKLDQAVVTIEQAMVSTEAKFVGLPGADIVLQASGVVNALDSTLGAGGVLNQGLANVQGKLVGLAGADIKAQIDAGIDVLDSSALVTTFNGALTSIKGKVGDITGNGYIPALGGDDLVTQLDAAVGDLDSTLGAGGTLNQGLAVMGAMKTAINKIAGNARTLGNYPAAGLGVLTDGESIATYLDGIDPAYP